MKRKDEDVNGLGREAAPALPTIPDVEAPKDKAAYETLVDHAVARLLTIATTAKELTDGIKVSKEWYEARHQSQAGGVYGANLLPQNGVTHGG